MAKRSAGSAKSFKRQLESRRENDGIRASSANSINVLPIVHEDYQLIRSSNQWFLYTTERQDNQEEKDHCYRNIDHIVFEKISRTESLRSLPG